MREFERLPAADGLAIARVTYELLRPVPVGPIEIQADISRPGRRVQLLEGSIFAGGLEVVRARALQVQRADPGTNGATEETPPPPGPENGRPARVNVPHRPMFAFDAIEITFVAGAWGGGPSTAWFRLRSPIVAGETPSPLERLAAAGDFGNGMSSVLSWDDYVYINPDLTLYIEREPVGEWICLDARMIVVDGGAGFSEAVLYDERGRVGRSLQSLYVAPSAT